MSSLFCGLRIRKRNSDYGPGLKILLVGDRGSGKTKLAKRYKEKLFTTDPEGDLAELYHITIDKTSFIVYDPPAGEGDSNTYKNMYCNANIIILCFDVCNKSSLKSIEEKWLPALESAGCAESYRVLLVGTKEDDRDRQMNRGSRIGPQGNTVSHDEGKRMCKKINSCAYLECSAKTGKDVDAVFRVAAMLASERKKLGKSWFVKSENWFSGRSHKATTFFAVP